MNEILRTLAKQLETDYPEARINLDLFPSGAGYLDIVKNGRHFLMRYFPDRREYGVDEVLPSEGFFEKYALITTDLAEATNFLRKLVDARPSHVNGATSPSTINSAAS